MVFAERQGAKTHAKASVQAPLPVSLMKSAFTWQASVVLADGERAQRPQTAPLHSAFCSRSPDAQLKAVFPALPRPTDTNQQLPERMELRIPETKPKKKRKDKSASMAIKFKPCRVLQYFFISCFNF